MSEKLLSNRRALMNMIRRIAYDAGQETLKYFDHECEFDTSTKKDGSPVTDADREAEKIIGDALCNLLPSVPMIGEESFNHDNFKDFDFDGYFWLVDPIDGTKNFISGSPEYTVNIALIYQREPVLGVVYAPALGELYAGCEGRAIKWIEATDSEKEIRTRKAPSSGLVVLDSSHHSNKEKVESFVSSYKVNQIKKQGSSLKFCSIASGKADMHPRYGQTNEWDTAAGQAVIESAGGKVFDHLGNPMRYGKIKDKLINKGFFVLSHDVPLIIDGNIFESGNDYNSDYDI